MFWWGSAPYLVKWRERGKIRQKWWANFKALCLDVGQIVPHLVKMKIFKGMVKSAFLRTKNKECINRRQKDCEPSFLRLDDSSVWSRHSSDTFPWLGNFNEPPRMRKPLKIPSAVLRISSSHNCQGLFFTLFGILELIGPPPFFLICGIKILTKCLKLSPFSSAGTVYGKVIKRK